MQNHFRPRNLRRAWKNGLKQVYIESEKEHTDCSWRHDVWFDARAHVCVWNDNRQQQSSGLLMNSRQRFFSLTWERQNLQYIACTFPIHWKVTAFVFASNILIFDRGTSVALDPTPEIFRLALNMSLNDCAVWLFLHFWWCPRWCLHYPNNTWLIKHKIGSGCERHDPDANWMFVCLFNYFFCKCNQLLSFVAVWCLFTAFLFCSAQCHF